MVAGLELVLGRDGPDHVAPPAANLCQKKARQLTEAGFLDGVVTQRAVVQRAFGILKDCKVDIVGTLVNNATDVLPYYYSYNYYGYKY